MSAHFNPRPHFRAFTSLFFLAADTGGGSGEQTETPKATADISTLPKAKARVESLESEVTSLTNARDQALTAQRTAESERDKALSSATKAVTERDEAQTALTSAQSQLQAVTKERDQAHKERDKEKINVTRLEKLCGVSGIDPKNLPPAADDQNPSKSQGLYDQWQKLEGGAKTTFYRAHRTEIRAAVAALNADRRDA